MKWGRIGLVIVGAVVLTALGIDAADTLQGNSGTLLSQVIRSDSVCGKGMVQVDTIPGIRCVDQYEVSTGELCPVRSPQSMIESLKNVDTKNCTGESKSDAPPWNFVTRDQAAQICARDGKRLPTNAEWHELVLGMAEVESSCNVSSKRVSPSGSYGECTSPEGVYDLVGNLWEWTSDDVIDGTYNMRKLPESGYVAQVDGEGVPVLTREDGGDPLFGNDYFWSSDSGFSGIVRGGYYDSGSDAGIYTMHADTLTNTASIGIGFRCVR